LTAIKAYDQAANFLENQTLVSARKLRELGAGFGKKSNPSQLSRKLLAASQSIELKPFPVAID